MTDEDGFQAGAYPVKRFFIDVVTQDIQIIDTIPEFVDNSIDGANRLSEEDEDLSGLRVEIELDENGVAIKDNCGGISRELAEDYAFRFGRPEEINDQLESRIGEYGVGMKRSLFKLGRSFTLESNPEEGYRFLIDVDVDEWESHDDWNFDAEIIYQDDPRCELDEPGTRIEIDDLREEAGQEFEDEIFISQLKNKLVSRFNQYLQRDFQIILNKDPLGYTSIDMLQSDDIEPAYRDFDIEHDGTTLNVDIRSGVGKSDPDRAGWYVFCNGRLVLEADQSPVTGWDGDAIPKFHGQFNRFRGVVNFKSEDPGALPWNTTKTDVNSDSMVFQKARQKMISEMRPVVDFMNEIRSQQREMDLDDKKSTPLEQKVESASSIDANEVESDEQKTFSSPEPDEVELEEDDGGTTNILYEKPIDEVEEVKEEMGVSTNKDVGLKTFEYFYNVRME